MENGFFFVTGIDLVCALLTLVYIGKLLWDSLSLERGLEAALAVSKISLRGQQVARRLR